MRQDGRLRLFYIGVFLSECLLYLLGLLSTFTCLWAFLFCVSWLLLVGPLGLTGHQPVFLESVLVLRYFWFLWDLLRYVQSLDNFPTKPVLIMAICFLALVLTAHTTVTTLYLVKVRKLFYKHSHIDSDYLLDE
jgi:hypothetical protein